MKSVQFKCKSSEKVNNPKKFKQVKADKQNFQTLKSEYLNSCEGTRPGSCPTNNSSYTPSRDWHQYLSKQQLLSSPQIPRSNSNWHETLTKSSELPLNKSTDELITLKLPTVNFCSLDKDVSQHRKALSINDLCDEDKKKIALLVEEIARCKQEKQEDEEIILTLKNNVAELKASLKNSLAEKSSENKSVSLIKSLHLSEQTALKKQLAELNQLLYQMQVQKSTSEVQMKTITSQAEKMTRAIHAMHRENTELQIELRVAKERLGVAQQAVDKMTKDLKEVQEHIRPLTEDKACQSAEDIGSERFHVKTINTSEKIGEDQNILSELFFNNKLQNSFSPKETIIFLPVDSNVQFNNI